MSPRYFTKSIFNLAMDCPSKLYFTGRDEYSDQSEDDNFLAALAEGGYQVGELAKYLFCEDPAGEDITVKHRAYDAAVEETEFRRRKKGRIIIAEGAFRYKDFFVRVDLLEETKDCIRLYEVKAKACDEDTVFLKTKMKGPEKGKKYPDSNWLTYLYDVAFQKWVVQNATGKRVKAHLILADKTVKTTTDGLNQLFRIIRRDDQVTITVKESVTRKNLGSIPLKIHPVDDACEWIYTNKVDVGTGKEYAFEPLLSFLSKSFKKNEWIRARIGSHCRDCQFRPAEVTPGTFSGFHECWKVATGLSPAELDSPLALELWGGLAGSKSPVSSAISEGFYLLHQIPERIYIPGKRSPVEGNYLDPTARRTMQIRKSIKNDFTPHIDREGLKRLFDRFSPPYHFIDFETSMVALPFHKNRRPYEAIAFQYSYHRMDEKGKIVHQNDWLSFEKGVFPNYDFLRSLRNDLSGKQGTIFRYHNHENTYLLLLYQQLKEETRRTVPDKDELMSFIREIAQPSGKTDSWVPRNEMQDLYKIVINHFYSLYARGSNSIKSILPAVIRSSDFLRAKYSRPVYGTKELPSRNFKEPHTWIQKKTDYNPYLTLPQVFTGLEKNNLSHHNGMDELKDGGAAMMAYAYLQFSEIDEPTRMKYRDALLRYCELDTMAMVMIWEYFREVRSTK